MLVMLMLVMLICDVGYDLLHSYHLSSVENEDALRLAMISF